MYDPDPDTFAAEKLAAKAARAEALPAKRAARADAANEAAAALALALVRADEHTYRMPVELLFSPALLAANGRPGTGAAFVRFMLPGREPMDFERKALARVAVVLRRRPGTTVELLAGFDPAGGPGWLRFHFGAKGRLDVPSRLRAIPEYDDVVVVAPPVALAPVTVPAAASNDTLAA